MPHADGEGPALHPAPGERGGSPRAPPALSVHEKRESRRGLDVPNQPCAISVIKRDPAATKELKHPFQR